MKKEFFILLKLGLPAIFAQLAQMSMGVIDTMMAGRVSSEALAAIAIGTNVLSPVMIFIMGIFIALNPIVAHLNGRGEREKIGRAFHQGIIAALLLTLPAIFLLWNADGLLTLMGIQPDIIPVAAEYLQACCYGLVFLFLHFAFRFCNEGLFSNKAILWVVVAGIPFNIVLNYWFIWGGLGLPALGAVGVGYATSVVWFILFLGMALYSILTPRYKSFRLLEQRFRIDPDIFKELFKIGLPMGISVALEILMFSFVGLLIGRYAVHIVAAHQVALNITSMAYMIPLGLSIAITARVGYFAGKNKTIKLRVVSKIGIVVALSFAVFSALLMFTLPEVFIGLYSKEPALVEVAIQLLFFAAVFQISDALQVSAMGALRGLKDSKIPMILTATAYWLIGFPVGYYLAEIEGMGASGYWIGIIAGLSSAGVLLLIRLMKLIHQPRVFRNESIAD